MCDSNVMAGVGINVHRNLISLYKCLVINTAECIIEKNLVGKLL